MCYPGLDLTQGASRDTGINARQLGDLTCQNSLDLGKACCFSGPQFYRLLRWCIALCVFEASVNLPIRSTSQVVLGNFLD